MEAHLHEDRHWHYTCDKMLCGVRSKAISIFNMIFCCFLLAIILLDLSSPSHDCFVTAQTMVLKKPGCGPNDIVRIDRAIARLVPFGPTGRKMPEKPAEQRMFCRESRNLTARIESFIHRCFARETLPTGKLAFYPAKKSAQQFCSKNFVKIATGKRVERMLSITPCINQNFRQNDTCLRRFMDDLHAITIADPQTIDEKMKIPRVCCSTIEVQRCVEDQIEGHKCSRDHKEAILDFMSNSMGDFLGVACGEYSDESGSDKCDKLPPLPHHHRRRQREEAEEKAKEEARRKKAEAEAKAAKEKKEKEKEKQHKNEVKKIAKKKKQNESRKQVAPETALAQTKFLTPLFLMIDLLGTLGDSTS